MHPHFQKILDEVKSNKKLTEKQRSELISYVEEAEKLQSITEFKLDRTEKVKRTTAILLEETINELEKKNRDVQIEAALERIRGQAMGMTSSSDLPLVMNVFYEEITRLQLTNETTDIELCLVDEEVKTLRTWSSASNFSSPEQLTSMVELNKVPVLKKQFLEWKKQPLEMRKTLDLGFECRGKSWQKMLESLSSHPDWSEGIKVFYENNIEEWYWHHAYNRFGSVVINSALPIVDSSIPLLKRVSQVFEQTYTRFLDLQKAEAQAREAQIEAALERVRSRTMAMHKTDELLEVGELLNHEISELGISSLTSGYVLMDQEEKIGWNYTPNSADGSLASKPLGIPHTETKPMRSILKSWKKGAPFHVVELDTRETIEHQTFIAKRTINFPYTLKKLLSHTPEKLVLQTFNFRQGYLLYVGGVKFSEDQIIMMTRFAKVFEQTYTRFLDLQKAEAQAREAQIEAALERVRSRSMAMHHSNELREVVATMYEQMESLHFAMIGVEIILCDEKSDHLQFWSSSIKQSLLSERYDIPRSTHPFFKKAWNAWKKKTPHFVITLKGEDKKEFDQHIFQKTDFKKFPAKIKNYIRSRELDVFTFATMKYGLLEAVDDNPIPDDQVLVLQRFAKVFEQTYTRFLDLQKAEAQAREAQIEAALERSRAKTMAMHNSSELEEVALTFVEQLEVLGMTVEWVNLLLHNPDEDSWQLWLGYSKQYRIKKIRKKSFTLNLPQVEDDPTMEAWKAGEKVQVTRISSKEIGPWMTKYKVIFDITGQDIKVAKSLYKDGFYRVDAFMKYGLFGAGAVGACTEEEIDIQCRFAKEFERTYQRFLDLKKAEAQAREAQIEASLERVRASSLAMHQSEDLNTVLNTMFQELAEQGLDMLRLVIWIYHEEDHSATWWAANPEVENGADSFHIPWVQHEVYELYWENWKSRKKRFHYVLKNEVKKSWDDYLFNQTEMARLPDPVKQAMIEANPVHLYNTYHDFGLLMLASGQLLEDEVWVIERFAQVFNQSYTRFLDLQKAEAQAREAQIEAALERVRAATMAMHQSEEIKSVLNKIFEELTLLDLVLQRIMIWIFNTEENYVTWWSANREEVGGVESYNIQYNDHAVSLRYYKAWGQQVPIFQYTLSGKEKVSWEDFLFTRTGMSRMPKKVQQGMRAVKTIYTSSAINEYGLMMAGSLEPLSASNIEIIKRFSAVFQQSYSRFKDIQKAEAQAREAQIEAALERVRAQSLAMHKSEELQEVVGELHQQLRGLDIEMDATQIEINEDDPDNIHIWVANDQQPYGSIMRLPHLNNPMLLDFLRARNKGEKEFSGSFTKAEKNRYYKEAFRKTDLKNIPEIRKQQMFDGEGLAIYASFVDKTALHLLNFNGREYQLEERIIVKRFALVFEQSYTRFLDLKKAEAQAREAQIEAALERVRSGSLAMHNSKDLHKIVNLVLSEMEGLQIPMSSALINEFRDPAKDQYFWAAADGMIYPEIVHLPYIKNQFFTRFNQARLKSESFFSDVFTKGEKNRNWHHYFAHSAVPEDRQKYVLSTPGIARSTALFSNTAVTILRYDKTPFNEEENKILIRFGQVFQQAYTRFLDLQKAEAQAREAQIEAALERVRSRSMAMHKSEELLEVIKVVFDQISSLGVAIDSAQFDIFEKGSNDINGWIATNDYEYANRIRTPYFKSPVIDEYHKFKKKRPCTYNISYSKAEKDKYFNHTFKHTELSKIPDKRKKMLLSRKGLVQGGAILNDLSLGINNYDGIAFTDYDVQIIRRFAEVFDQTYTRFLDLQKAEAQAREAQIEAALERVRSKMMAMHKSDELREVISTVFTQLGELGFDAPGINLIVFDENHAMEHWMSGFSYDLYPRSYKIPYNDHPYFVDIFNAWKAQVPFQEFIFEGKSKLEYAEWAIENSDFKHMPKEFKKEMKDPARLTLSDAFNKYGMLEIMGTESLKQNEIEVLIRFSKVFEQTYSRFLDLQKAETQAEEAQIEVALERIRARALAMQTSEELLEVANVMREQMRLLGQPQLEASVIHLYHTSPDYFESWYSMRPPGKKSKTVEGIAHFYYNDHVVAREVLKAYHAPESEYTLVYNGKKFAGWFDTFKVRAPDIYKSFGKNLPKQHVYSFADFTGGSLLMVSHEEPSLKSKELLKRTSAAFDLAYKRYLDLKNAESQAREAQIEAALERVRAAAMAMHNSQDVHDATTVMFNELENLGITTIRCGVAIIEEKKQMEVWASTSTAKDGVLQISGKVDMTVHPLIDGVFEAWNRKEVKFSYDLVGSDVKRYYKVLADTSTLPIPDLENLPKRQSITAFNFDEGALFAFTSEPLSADASEIFHRFTKVFTLTYRRFLDLQKAEAQAREAQIEASLERVRASSLAMHNTEELANVSAVLYDELLNLGITSFESCGFHIVDEENKVQQIWNYHIDLKQLTRFQMPLTGDSVFDERYAAWKRQESIYYKKVGDKILNDHLEFSSAQDLELGSASSWTEKFGFPDPVHFHFGNFSKGYLHVIAAEELTDEHKTILGRFAKVFEQAYTRFLDLQKAEAQAREAQIEVALERIRARALAMHSSEEFVEVVNVLREQMETLDQPGLQTSVIHIYPDNSETFQSYYAFGDPTKNEKLKIGTAEVPYDASRLTTKWMKHYHSDIIEYTIEAKGKELTEWLETRNRIEPRMRRTMKSNPKIQYYHFSDFSGGSLITVSSSVPSEDVKSLQKRTASVFDLAYRRYVDLKHAENQAREGQIEAALERVRSRTMAMHHSDELADAATLLFQELLKFNVLNNERDRFSLFIRNEKTGHTTIWGTQSGGNKIERGIKFIAQDLPRLASEDYEKWKATPSKERKNVCYYIQYKGKDLEEYSTYLYRNPAFKKEVDTIMKYTGSEGWFFTNAYFSQGLMSIQGFVEPAQSTLELLKRFAGVFEQTYVRFLDLKKAEAREKEAIKQASLDRVRAEIASMRTTNDLNRITPLVWRELTTLGVPFFRCGVFIIDDNAGMVYSFLSTPSGESLAAWQAKIDSQPLFKNAVVHWRKQEVFRDSWDQQQFIDFTESLIEQGVIESPKKYQAGDEAPEFLALQMIPFTQGMLYVGSSESLSEDHIDLVKSLSESFSVAYARYEDFRELEQAKEQVEGTLTELKSAQDQLVHSEKMASLGELTAGIAHEIQNPLNFVNNFSDINKELAEELIEEIKNGNAQEAEAIIADIVNNEEKIHHHGKRAEEIVRSMLLHSRGSSGEKELTDINLLADEYMRLSFHGMRAKDKSFNADFKLDLEEGLPKLKVVQQDIGRVLLNLINNAFYATNEKARNLENGRDYKPTVTLSTKNLKDSIEILLNDNGSGIPKNVLDKIFQPFFSTKPTGQGTGLGLSLSFDIITKGHGGTIDVLSKEGKGTEFIITLPIV